jgi:dihydroorotase
MLIATHCEDEATIRAIMAKYRSEYGENVPIKFHPEIRSEEACYKSSSMAVELATKYGTRLHVLHISTAKELELFSSEIPLKEKKITAEACIHHLWFTQDDYAEKGTLIKWNPAVKTAKDRLGIWDGLNANKIDVLATDHAPHTLEEKRDSYFNAPSGGPLVQDAVLAILQKTKEGLITLERAVEKMSHAVADCFEIDNRGYIREGYYADLVVIDPNKSHKVDASTIRYKCGWSPFEGITFDHTIDSTFVNGQLVYTNSGIIEGNTGKRMTFKG